MEKTPWGQVLLIVGAGMVAAFQVGKAPPVLLSIRADLGMSLFLSGWILSILGITGILAGAVAGAVADAFGHRRLILQGLIVQAIGSLVGSFAAGPVLLLATRVLEGVGFFIVIVSAPALVFRVTRYQDVRLALSIWSCFMPTGVAIIMLTTPLLMVWAGWRGVWQVNAGIATVYAFLLARRTRHLTDPKGRSVTRTSDLWRDVKRTATSPGPVFLAAIFFTYTLQWQAVMGFLPTLLIERHGVHPGIASVLTAIVVLMNVPGNLAAGRLLHRGFRRWHLIAVSSLTMGLCSLVIYSNQLPFMAGYLGCLVFSGLGGLLPASVLSGAPAYAPSPKLVATTTGLIMQGSQLGNVLGPPAVAYIVSMTGAWTSASWILGTSAAAGLGLSYGLSLLGKVLEKDV